MCFGFPGADFEVVIRNKMAGAVHQHQQRLQRRVPLYRDHFHPLDEYDDVDLFERFRFRRGDIARITDLLREDLQFAYMRKGALEPELQVLVALRFYATGSFQIVVGDTVNVNKSTVSRTLHRVSAALCARAREHIRLPDQRGADAQKRLFVRMGLDPGLANVLGCVDGTQIRIQGPVDNEHEYVNRRGKHSINVQIVSDAECRIINCVVKNPGSVHDARMVRESSLWRVFENQPPVLNGVMLGDSAYPLREWLMTPFLNPNNVQERRYNQAFKTTRATVERCIGILKRRFHCLHSELRYSPGRACRIITACIVLHNLAIDFGTPLEDDSADDADDDELEVCDMQPARGGRVVRQAMVNRFAD